MPAGAPNHSLDVQLKVLEKGMTTASLLLLASLEALACSPNAPSLGYFYNHYIGRYSSELSQLLPFLSCVA